VSFERGTDDATARFVDITTGLTAEVEQATTAEEINAKFTEAAAGPLQGILGVTRDPIVSTDIIQDSRSSIADLEMTKVLDGTFVKVVSWYDNEWGYSSRCIDMLLYLAEQG